MYEDLARSQRPSPLEWLVVNMILPTLLVTFALQVQSSPRARPRVLHNPVICVLPVLGLDERQARFGPIPDFFPKLLSMPRPDYRPFLGSVVDQPRVFLRALVEPDGSVSPWSIVIVQSPDPEFNQPGRVLLQTVTVVSATHPGFVAPARQALMATLFRPAMVGGRTVRMRVRIPYEFSIRDGMGRVR